MKLADLEMRRVAVWGFGVEARATLDYFSKHLPELDVTVLCPPNEADDNSVEFSHELVTAKLLSGFDVVVKSPGISPYQTAVEQAECRFTSASALWFSNEKNRFEKPPKVIAVTGTKGKSTACYLLHEALKAAGFNTVLAGNFGVPLIACSGDYDYIILETSSYQAQDGAIVADIAVLLNLYSEHLDWHGSHERYQLDKWRLLQQANTVFLNAKDAGSQDLLITKPLHSYQLFNEVSGFYVLDEVLMCRDKAVLSTAGWPLPGAHNLTNLAAVLSVLVHLNCPLMPALNCLKKLQPLPHRLQPLDDVRGVHVINDSIASTPHATWAAIQTCPPAQTILLVGGYDRGVDWQWFAQKIAQLPPKLIICSGANGAHIQKTLNDYKDRLQTVLVDDLKSAVAYAFEHSQHNDYLLLSPGAPSFDAFKNYQQRGQLFEQWVKNYDNEDVNNG